MKNITLFANAKINLFLDIESRREDGYHNISSLMQSVDLHDVVTVSYEESDRKVIEISVNDPAIPANEKNIAYKAADRLIDCGHVKIHIEKNIPSPAGLAGGSADAAAVIFALTEFGCVNKTNDEIMSIAAKIGADVPFCLVGGTKKISGIGDVIEDIPELSDINIVIAVDGEGVSTPAAYGMLDEKYDNFVEYSGKTFNFESFSIDEIFNIFEEAVLPIREKAAFLKAEMIKLGASAAIMSGSGPSVVGIFDDSASAEKCAESLRDRGVFAKACKTVKRGIETKNSAEAEF